MTPTDPALASFSVVLFSLTDESRDVVEPTRGGTLGRDTSCGVVVGGSGRGSGWVNGGEDIDRWVCLLTLMLVVMLDDDDRGGNEFEFEFESECVL